MRRSVFIALGVVLAAAMGHAQEPWYVQGADASSHGSDVDLTEANAGWASTYGGWSVRRGHVPDRMGDTADGDVTIMVEPYNPPITVPASGGTFQYTVTATNNETTPLTFQVWTIAVLPNGNPYGPVFGPVYVHLPGGWSASGDLLQYVPDFAPAGTYTYRAHVGLYPYESWDSDSFAFDKLSGGGWYPQSPAASYSLTGVAFVDVETGWAVSDYREIIHTTDGGDTWYHQDDQQPYPEEYNDVCFVDAQTGWVVGSTILHTTDAGENWTAQDSYYDYELYSVHFVDANNGWAVGGYVDYFGSNHKRVIEHTANGGATWYGQFGESYEYPFHSVHFADADHGWAVGRPGAIFQTTNGGSSWNEQTSGTTADLEGVFFTDANTGWCVGAGGTVLHTTNGGGYWYPQDSGTNDYLEGVHFVDSSTGWIVGASYPPYQGVVLHTTDGGDTWSPQSVPIGEYLLYDVCFIGADHGWAAGGMLYPYSGVMLHTETGGE